MADAEDRLRAYAQWADDQHIPVNLDAVRAREPSSGATELAPVDSTFSVRTRRSTMFAAAAAAVLLIGAALLVGRGDRSSLEAGTTPSPGMNGGWTLLPDLTVDDRLADPFASAVWTGSEAIIVGGLAAGSLQGTIPTSRGEGLRPMRESPAFNPSTRTWRLLPAPPHELALKAWAWTGDKIVIAGAEQPSPSCSSCGAGTGVLWLSMLDPANGIWSDVGSVSFNNAIGANELASLAVVWTGDRGLVIGPRDFQSLWVRTFGIGTGIGDEQRWDLPKGTPAPHTWFYDESDFTRFAATVSAPSGREFIVYIVNNTVVAFDTTTGQSRAVAPAPFAADSITSTGTKVALLNEAEARLAIWDSSTDSWHETPKVPWSAGEPHLSGLYPFDGGSRLIVWSRGNANEDPSGALYDSATDRWSPIPRSPNNAARGKGVWTGSSWFTWGLPDSSTYLSGPITAAIWTPPRGSLDSATGGSIPDVAQPRTPPGWRVWDFGDFRFAVPPGWQVPISRSCWRAQPDDDGVALVSIDDKTELETCNGPEPLPSAALTLEGGHGSSPSGGHRVAIGTFTATLVDPPSCAGCLAFWFDDGYQLSVYAPDAAEILATFTKSARSQALEGGPVLDTSTWQTVRYEGVLFSAPSFWPTFDASKSAAGTADTSGNQQANWYLNPGECTMAMFPASKPRAVYIGVQHHQITSCSFSGWGIREQEDSVWVQLAENTSVPPGATSRQLRTGSVDITAFADASKPEQSVIHVLVPVHGTNVLVSIGAGPDPAVARTILHSIRVDG